MDKKYLGPILIALLSWFHGSLSATVGRNVEEAMEIVVAPCGPDGLACGLNDTEGMHEDIIKLESRMIIRDAFTRHQMKRLRMQLHAEKKKMTEMKTSMQVQEIAQEKVKSKCRYLESDMETLHDTLLDLRKRLHFLESYQNDGVLALSSNKQIELKLDETCPPGYSRNDDSCYTFVREKRSWYKAEDHCKQLNGHLLDIQTKDEQEFIVEFLKEKRARRDSFWVYIGGNDLNKDGKWTWIGTKDAIDLDPTYWYRTDTTPDPEDGYTCMFLFLWDTQNFAKWTKDKCYYEMPSICEIQLGRNVQV